MTADTYRKANVLLGTAGVLFSGYMSSVKFFTSDCVFQEPCPMFLGYPACYFGFGLFSTLLAIAILGAVHRISDHALRTALRTVSLAGILFAGYFVAAEGLHGGTLGLPTCAYGLLFFLTIFGFSFKRTDAQKLGPRMA